MEFYPENNSIELPSFLDAHQDDGVRHILTRSRSYLAHAPGAGKTAQAIVAALCLGVGTVKGAKAHIVVPPSLTANWVREIMKFTQLYFLEGNDVYWPRIGLVPESGNQQYTGWESDFLVIPDSMIHKPWVIEKLQGVPKTILIGDEGSRFKEATSQRTIALFGGRLTKGRKTPGLMRKAEFAVLMDGSPMPNRPMELWAPTYAMCPEAIDHMSQQDFGFRYCGPKLTDYGYTFNGSCREDELRQRLQKDFMHVVTESQLSHSERLRSMLYMPSDVRSREHKAWEAKNLSKHTFNDLSEDMSQGDMARFRRELGLRKVPFIARYAVERLEKNESILLFAWHREVCLELARALAKFHPRTVIGGTAGREREESFQLFQSGKRKILIMNIAAGGRGHNLQRADRIIFGEFSWTDEYNIQCEKRASRRGRDIDLPVKCDYIVAPDSMDEPMLQGIFKKAQRVKRVIG